jgi:hypothetical protein
VAGVASISELAAEFRKQITDNELGLENPATAKVTFQRFEIGGGGGIQTVRF